MKGAKFGSVVFVGMIAATSASQAQSGSPKDRIVGAWSLVSNVNTNAQGVKSTPWGEHPLGTYMFDSAGHFAEIIINPDKDGATVDYFGTYTVDEPNKALKVHIVGSSASRFNGTDATRAIGSMSDDEFTTINSNASVGGTAEVTWKRVR